MADPREGPGPRDDQDELAYWRRVAEQRAAVIESLHEFNYWHEAAGARGEVIAGLEASVAEWRRRAEAAEDAAAPGVRRCLRVLVRRALGRARRD